MSGSMSLLITLILVPAIPLIVYIVYEQYTQRTINKSSIKYSMDHLPAGMAFYLDDGMVILSNRMIQTLARSMTNEILMNGNRFYDLLLSHSSEKEGDAFIVRFDNRVYEVRHIGFDYGSRRIHQLSITDASNMKETEADLQNRLRELERLRLDLERYRKEVDTLARNEAFYATRVRIHDLLAQELLATRHLLQDPPLYGSAEDQAATRWKQVIRDLRMGGITDTLVGIRSAKQDIKDIMDTLTQAARAIGLTLAFEGEPVGGDVKQLRLITSSARICMTNAVRHGNATRMKIGFIKDRNTGMLLELCYSNNGDIPPKDMIRGGGLTMLENLVREGGGSVAYEFEPEFRVRIKLNP